MDTINRMSLAVRARFNDFWCSGMLCPKVDADADGFSGLGCLFLVRRFVANDVAIFEFASSSGASGWRPVSLLDEPLLLWSSLVAV